jgi:hypothetical protein
MGIPDGGTADRNSALINPEGVTLEEVYSAVSSLNPDFDVRVILYNADLWLWPMWSQWEMPEGDRRNRNTVRLTMRHLSG